MLPASFLISQTDIKCILSLKKSETLCKYNEMGLINYAQGEKIIYVSKIIFQVFLSYGRQ